MPQTTAAARADGPAASPASGVVAAADHDSATCLGCDYPLRGLGDARRCPECGRAFDPADPLTMRTPQRVERALRRALWWAPMSAWLVIVLGVFTFGLLTRYISLVTLIAGIFVAGFVRRLARRSLLAGAADPNPASERLARVGTWLLCFLLLFGTDQVKISTCPH